MSGLLISVFLVSAGIALYLLTRSTGAAGRIDLGALDRTRRNAASAALARTETLLAGPADRSQMLALADLPVPVHPGWRPAGELAEHCGAAGRVLRNEADEHRTRFGHWVREVNTLARAIRADVEARVETDITVLADGRGAARELLDKAAHEVRLRASALDGAQPEAT